MKHLHDEDIKKLEVIANDIRQSIIAMLERAKSGHTAGPLGMADIFTAFYFHILNHDPANPEWAERDRLILSNGHIVPVRYAAMAHAGYFPKEELMTLRAFGSRLQGHPERERLPGVETTSGPLGSGLGQAAGIALAARMDGKSFRTYCLMSDGEQDAGAIWESALFAGKYKLANLTGVIDRNMIQIDGSTEVVMPLESLRAKWEAFGWYVLECDGHNFAEFISAIGQAHAVVDRPTLIIAHTIPGKGVPEIEYDFKWHGTPPNAEQAKRFLHALRTLHGKIVSEHE
ncbi:MAG: transketolase [Candidatus Paceibacterota bacterium]|nr:MAG: transketolase [Candidatus Paceibacterota bacterium]